MFGFSAPTREDKLVGWLGAWSSHPRMITAKSEKKEKTVMFKKSKKSAWASFTAKFKKAQPQKPSTTKILVGALGTGAVLATMAVGATVAYKTEMGLVDWAIGGIQNRIRKFAERLRPDGVEIPAEAAEAM